MYWITTDLDLMFGAAVIEIDAGNVAAVGLRGAATLRAYRTVLAADLHEKLLMVRALSVAAPIAMAKQITEPDQVPDGLGTDGALDLFLCLFGLAQAPHKFPDLLLAPFLTVMSLSDLCQVRGDLPKRLRGHILFVRAVTAALWFIRVHRHSLKVHLELFGALLIHLLAHLWEIIILHEGHQSGTDNTALLVVRAADFGLRPVIASRAALALRLRQKLPCRSSHPFPLLVGWCHLEQNLGVQLR